MAVPAWSPFSTEEEQHQFLTGVETELALNGITAEVRVPAAGTVVASASDGRVLIDLDKVATVCVIDQGERWSLMIAGGLESILGEISQLGAVGDQWEYAPVADALRLHVVPTVERGLAQSLLIRPLAPDLDVIVVAQRLYHREWITRAQAQHWGVEDDAVWAEARRHTLSEIKDLTVTVHDVAAKGSARVFAGDGDYVSSLPVVLEDMLDEPAPYGALVTVPTNHHATVHVVRDADAVGLVPWLACLMGPLNRCPDPLSPSVYWWKEGFLHPVELSEQGGHPRIVLPPALEEFAAALPGGPPKLTPNPADEDFGLDQVAWKQLFTWAREAANPTGPQ